MWIPTATGGWVNSDHVVKMDPVQHGGHWLVMATVAGAPPGATEMIGYYRTREEADQAMAVVVRLLQPAPAATGAGR